VVKQVECLIERSRFGEVEHRHDLKPRSIRTTVGFFDFKTKNSRRAAYEHADSNRLLLDSDYRR